MYSQGIWTSLQQQDLIRRSIRSFFDQRGCLEVQTPHLVTCPGTEEHLDYFASSWEDHLGHIHPLWLRSSPELHMKQILAVAQQSIYQIAPCYRNKGELSAEHLPEFNMLEWYELGSKLSDLIETTVSLLRHIHIDWCQYYPAPDWGFAQVTSMTVAEAFERFAGICLVDQDPDLANKAREQGVFSVAGTDDFETAFYKIFIERVEPALANFDCAVLYGYPASQAILARVEEGVAQRFELYIRGIEMCNGFYELLEEQSNRERIQAALAARQKSGKELPHEDEDFYRALRQGIPECAGNALGVDRLHGLLARRKLADCIPFARRIPFGHHLTSYVEPQETSSKWLP
ncbi:MAG: hypothetical protein OXT67_07715 [Zetaproteobacteria bacterium]|nr:hypothetical protein [Zetaproteobacteria bacterium]